MPLLLLLDDVFMTFDGSRTADELSILNEISDRFQIIVSAHHGRAAELARTVLPVNRRSGPTNW